MPTEPTPEDMAHDLHKALGWLQYEQPTTFMGAIRLIAESACRRAIAAERERDRLKEECRRRIAAAEEEARLADEANKRVAALDADLAEMTRTALRDTGELADIIKAKDAELADARKGAEVAVALVRAELAEAVRLLRKSVINDEWHAEYHAFLAKHKG